jgi:pimeloyl-ACP methyl ester carboxylesterase
MITALAQRFHLIALDYPGFGNSDMRDPTKFVYTFDKTSESIELLVEKVGFACFGLYVHDYGGPVGFRIVTRRSDGLEWLIIQNTNGDEVGFTAAGMVFVAPTGRAGLLKLRSRSRRAGVLYAAGPGHAFRGSAARSSADRSHLPRSAAA